jgi:hypothetical protein
LAGPLTETLSRRGDKDGRRLLAGVGQLLTDLSQMAPLWVIRLDV